MVPFRAVVKELNALTDYLIAQGDHPPVNELCHNLNQRFKLLTESVETRCDLNKMFHKGT